MSVSRRIILSVSILMLLTLGTLGYQLSIVYRMQAVVTNLSLVNFVAASELVQMTEEAEELESMSRRFLAVGDEGNRAILERGLKARIDAFDAHVLKLEATLRPWEAPQEVAQLSSAWSHYKKEMDRLRRQPSNGGMDQIPLGLEGALMDLQSRTRSSSTAVLKGIADEVQRNQGRGSQARAVSFAAGVAFLLVASLLSYLAIHSINTPLRQLMKGTRTISGGEFSHRLPVDGPEEFAELAASFNQMSARLGELDQMKKDFVSYVSHELKAPLAAIRQTLAVTLDGIPGPINDKQRRLLTLSRNSAERLSSMVANLLDVSRLDAGTMEYDRGLVDIVEVVRNTTEEFALKAAELHIAIDVESNKPVIPLECDRDRMIQVVGNLIDNALKFSPPESGIVVKVESTSGGDGGRSGSSKTNRPQVLISVADHGVGIPDPHKEAVFRKFHQLRGGGKRSAGQGVGLGLAICKTIVDDHGGRIWIEDNAGGGSVFRVAMQGMSEQKVTS